MLLKDSFNTTPSTLAPTGQTVWLLIAFDLGTASRPQQCDSEPFDTQNVLLTDKSNT